MKKIYLFALAVISGFLSFTKVSAQCTPQVVYTPSAWEEPTAAGTPYTGYLCQGHDTLHTRYGWQYYDGDGYWFKMVAGSQVKIYVDSCGGTATSITLVDSTAAAGGVGTVITGAYSAAACPNMLTFTATYTGKYTLVFDSDGNCTTAGTTVVGTAAIKLLNPGTITNCNPISAPANDSLCGAVALTLNNIVSGNNTNAAVSDADDAAMTTLGYTCFTPNNTLWYSFTPSTSDSFFVYFAGPMPGWFGVVSTTASTNPCHSALTYVGCYYGSNNATASGSATADPWGGVIPTGDTVYNHLYLTAGTHYYFMIDGVAGAVGAFSFGVLTNVIGINEVLNESAAISIYPNPSTGILNISSKSTAKNVHVSIINTIGQEVYATDFDNIFGKKEINLSGMADGIYSIQFKSESGSVSKKVVLQNRK